MCFSAQPGMVSGKSDTFEKESRSIPALGYSLSTVTRSSIAQDG
jgi:hypothetical protein